MADDRKVTAYRPIDGNALLYRRHQNPESRRSEATIRRREQDRPVHGRVERNEPTNPVYQAAEPQAAGSEDGSSVSSEDRHHLRVDVRCRGLSSDRLLEMAGGQPGV